MYQLGQHSHIEREVQVDSQMREITQPGSNNITVPVKDRLDSPILPEEDRAVDVNPSFEDLLTTLYQTTINDIPGRPQLSRASLVVPRRPTPSPLQRRNAVRTSSGSSVTSSNDREGRRVSDGMAPFCVDKSRRLSAPAHPGRSISDPGSTTGSVSITRLDALLPDQPFSRPRSITDLPVPRSHFTLTSDTWPTSFRSPPGMGYADSDIVPLPPQPNFLHQGQTVPPPLSTPVVLDMPTPRFALHAATPLSPVRSHRETFDAALVEANRRRMSEQLLAQRKERRRSWTPGETSDTGFRGSARGKEETEAKRYAEVEMEDEPLEEWEKELRQMDAEQKIRNLEGTRRRNMNFKDWERKQRSEIVRQSLLGGTATMQ